MEKPLAPDQARAGLDPSGFDPSREADAMRLDITHLLYAIDRGYFAGSGLAESAFISCLRKYADPDFAPIKIELVS